MSDEFAGNDKAWINGYLAAVKEFRDTFNNTGGYCNSVSIPLINQKCDSMLKKIVNQNNVKTPDNDSKFKEKCSVCSHEIITPNYCDYCAMEVKKEK